MSHGGMLALGSAAPSPVRQISGAGRLPGAATAGDGGKVFPTLIVLIVCWPGVMEPAAALILVFCVPVMCPSLCCLTSPNSALLQPFPHYLHRPAFQSLHRCGTQHKDNITNLTVDHRFCLFLHCRPLGDDACLGISAAGSARPVPTQRWAPGGSIPWPQSCPPAGRRWQHCTAQQSLFPCIPRTG